MDLWRQCLSVVSVDWYGLDTGWLKITFCMDIDGPHTPCSYNSEDTLDFWIWMKCVNYRMDWHKICYIQSCSPQDELWCLNFSSKVYWFLFLAKYLQNITLSCCLCVHLLLNVNNEHVLTCWHVKLRCTTTSISFSLGWRSHDSPYSAA